MLQTIHGPISIVARFIKIKEILELKSNNPNNTFIDMLFQCLCRLGHKRPDIQISIKKINFNNKFYHKFFSDLLSNSRISKDILLNFAYNVSNSHALKNISVRRNPHSYLFSKFSSYLKIVYNNPNFNIKITFKTIDKMIDFVYKYFEILMYKRKYNEGLKLLKKFTMNGSIRTHFSSDIIKKIFRLFNKALNITSIIFIKYKKSNLYVNVLKQLKRFMSSFHVRVDGSKIIFVKYENKFCIEIEFSKHEFDKMTKNLSYRLTQFESRIQKKSKNIMRIFQFSKQSKRKRMYSK